MTDIFNPSTYQKSNVSFEDHMNWMNEFLKNPNYHVEMPTWKDFVCCLLGDDTVPVSDSLPPIMFDVARFTYAMLNVLPEEYSPIAQFLRNKPWDPSRGETSLPRKFYTDIVTRDELLVRCLDLVVKDYFYHVNTFTRTAQIQYADIFKLGNDVDTRKCNVFGWSSATIIFPNSVEVQFPCLPCTFSLGVMAPSDVASTIDIAQFDTRLCDDKDSTVAVLLPTLFSPCFNFPLMTMVTEVVASTAPMAPTPSLIYANPFICDQKNFNDLLMTRKLTLWEEEVAPSNPQIDPLLSIPFGKLTVQ